MEIIVGVLGVLVFALVIAILTEQYQTKEMQEDIKDLGKSNAELRQKVNSLAYELGYKYLEGWQKKPEGKE